MGNEARKYDTKAPGEAEKAGWDALSPKRRFELWAKHEDVAMHFNDLTMRLRVQALAGVAAAALLAGGIFSSQGRIETKALGSISIALAFVWGAIWLLDRHYYQPLLKGAVKQIYLLESWTPGLKLSTAVEAEVGNEGSLARSGFYLIIFLILSSGGLALLVWGKNTSIPPAPVIQVGTCTQAAPAAPAPAAPPPSPSAP
jgi:hypothetical protein